MQIRESAEDYLEAILVLSRKGGGVRSVDIATMLGVSKPSVSHAMKLLREDGYIAMDRYGTVTLMDKGAEIAEQIDAYSGRGSTILKGIGSYSKKDKDVVMCACNNKQMYTIKKMVHTIDPKAFTIIVESNEVVGEGFKEELPDIVQRWRTANRRIRDLWYAEET